MEDYSIYFYGLKQRLGRYVVRLGNCFRFLAQCRNYFRSRGDDLSKLVTLNSNRAWFKQAIGRDSFSGSSVDSELQIG